jgi:predicted sulfurtransferase
MRDQYTGCYMNRRDAMVVLLAAAGASCARDERARELSPKELEKLLENPQSVFFLDVRQPEEVRQLGSVEGYVNIPVGQLQSRLSEIPRDKVVVTL